MILAKGWRQTRKTPLYPRSDMYVGYKWVASQYLGCEVVVWWGKTIPKPGWQRGGGDMCCVRLKVPWHGGEDIGKKNLPLLSALVRLYLCHPGNSRVGFCHCWIKWTSWYFDSKKKKKNTKNRSNRMTYFPVNLKRSQLHFFFSSPTYRTSFVLEMKTIAAGPAGVYRPEETLVALFFLVLKYFLLRCLYWNLPAAEEHSSLKEILRRPVRSPAGPQVTPVLRFHFSSICYSWPSSQQNLFSLLHPSSTQK